MKIYIENYNIEKLYKKIKFLNEYLRDKTNVLEIYSDEGIYSVDQNNIYKISYLDRPTKKVKYTDNTIMMIDPSETIRTIVNQLPADNVIFNYTRYTYQIGANSKIKLVIDLMLNNMESTPYNFYFDVSNDIDINNPIFKEDINVFLFHLN
jgi:hypothetical protein